MHLYVSHPSGIDYKRLLYTPLRNSHLNAEHTIVLPHETSTDQFESRTYFEESCDYVIADVSAASTGQGIELGWADSLNIPILAVHIEGTEPSSAISVVADTVTSYGNLTELIRKIDNELSSHSQ